MEAAPRKSNPVAFKKKKKKSDSAVRFPEDVIVKILRRLPVRSVCRFKCVSRSWYKLISNPDHGVPQTLAGFFHVSWNGERFPRHAHHFTNVTGKGAPLIDPSFSFLPVPRKDVSLIDSCNGLLLCCCYEPGSRHVGPFHYVVCNPAMKKWIMLPYSSRAADEYRTARLGFDPMVSSHFHVMEYVVDLDEYIIGVEIYSSKTAAWSFKESKWGDDVMFDNTSCNRSRSVFLNGFMHMLTYCHGIIVVDMEGKTWRKIPVLDDIFVEDFIYQSHGRLIYFYVDDYACKLSMWILEDYSTDEWTMKYKVSTLRLFGGKKLRYGNYQVIAVHPECNLVLFVYGWDSTLMAYEMGRREVRVIRNLGHESDHFLPYVPFFSDSLAEEQ